MDETLLEAALRAQRNKALMQRIFEDIGRGDGTLFFEHLAQDASMTVTGEYSWSHTRRGKEQIREFFRTVRSRLAQRPRTQAFHFIADGDWVAVQARGDMVARSGEPYRNHYCLLYRLQDGRIVEMKEYQDSALCERLLGPLES